MTWMFNEQARHEFSDDRPADSISVGHDGANNQMLVFDGPGGLETIIRFDYVVATSSTIEFYKRVCGRSTRTGSLEGFFDQYGDVGDYLEDRTR